MTDKSTYADVDINDYKNPDPSCTYPFTPDPLGYCWSYANHVDGTLGYEDVEEMCSDCEFWKPAGEQK